MKSRGRALLAMGPMDTIAHPLWDANRDLQESTNSDRHASLQGLQDSAAVPSMGRGVQPVTHMLSQGFLGFLLRSTDEHPGFTEVCPELAEGSAWRALENVPATRTSLGSGDDDPGRSL